MTGISVLFAHIFLIIDIIKSFTPNYLGTSAILRSRNRYIGFLMLAVPKILKCSQIMRRSFERRLETQSDKPQKTVRKCEIIFFLVRLSKQKCILNSYLF